MAAASPAAIAVFDTIELLENILICLGFTDLSQAQYVSRHFHDAVHGPLKLKRMLFLEPYSPHSAIPWKRIEASEPLLPPDIVSWLHTRRHRFPTSPTSCVILNVHPILKPSKPALGFVSPHSLDVDFEISTVKKMTTLDPNSRQMFATQPPMARVMIGHRAMVWGYTSSAPGWRGREGRSCQRFYSVTNVNGVRLGQVVDKLQEIVRMWQKPSRSNVRFERGLAYISAQDAVSDDWDWVAHLMSMDIVGNAEASDE